MKINEGTAHNLLLEIYDYKDELAQYQEIVDCVEKQISEFPIEVPDDDECLYFHKECPSCGQYLSEHFKVAYCYNCGQKIRWK